MTRRKFAIADFLLAPCLFVLPAIAVAQTTAPAVTPSQAAPAEEAPAQMPLLETPPPTGAVLFERETPLDPDAPAPQVAPTSTPSVTELPLVLPGKDDPLHVTDAERDALTFTAYDLDAHLKPASAAIAVRAAITVRNDTPQPLNRLILQISSSLRWEGFSALGSGTKSLSFVARRVATDADHTGFSTEAVVALPQPLAPGATLALTALYSGTIPPSAERLQRIGAPDEQASASDWDAIASSGTNLRGFGNVLWYPSATAPVFLGDGAKLFQAAGIARLRQQQATVRLRLAVEYLGDPPDAVFFCGRRQRLVAISDNADIPSAEAPGIATASFDPQPLGFRTPSLFITSHPETLTGTTDKPGLIGAVTDHYPALASYAAAATLVEPTLSDWYGAIPQTRLSLLDHPGQPFEDDALLVRPLEIEDAATLAPSLIHSLTHAWTHSTYPWIDEGLPQFTGLLWTEHTAGRAAALDQLQEAARTLSLAEPADPDAEPGNSKQGQSLLAASSDIFYRTKAAAVWWMLRDLVGDKALQRAFQAYRADPKLDREPNGFEHLLEKVSNRDLRWFFADWVDRDRGLPDLTIVNVTPRQLEARNGRPAGWLISIEVRNNGYAAVDVPVTVRAAPGHGSHAADTAATETQRLRVSGRSSASTRIVFAGTPDEIQVGDGGVPETRTSIHIQKLSLPAL